MINNTALTISRKLRKLVAERDYRLSDIRKSMETVLPELMQDQRNNGNTYTQREQDLLAQIVQIGVTFSENGKDLNRVDRQLADMITTLGKVLQGINIA